MVKKIILFDIDRTIFDTAKMANEINKVHASILKISLPEIQDAENKYILSLSNDNRFKTEEFINSICKMFSFQYPKELLNVIYDKRYRCIYDDIVFPEFFDVVEALKYEYKFGVYSEGDVRFQNHKFDSMKISKYIDKDLIFIVSAKDTPEVVRQLPKDAIVVDDKESICEYLTENGIKAIWLNKKDSKVNKNFETISNLLELPKKLGIL